MSSRDVVLNILPSSRSQTDTTVPFTTIDEWQNDSTPIQNLPDHTYFSSKRGRYFALADVDECESSEHQDEKSSRTLTFVRILTPNEKTRPFLLLFLLVSLALIIPIIITRVVVKHVSIGDVHLVGLFVWLEVIWIICWGAWGLAYLLPFGIQFVAGLITTRSRRYAELLQALNLPMTLFFWALLSRAATPVLCAFDQNRPGECDDEWILVLRKVLLATVASTGIFFVEKILIHILTINYRQKQFRVRSQDIERTVYILTLMYQASRDRFPIHCPKFATEDHKIHDSPLVDVADRKTTRQISTSTTGSRLSVMANNVKKRLAGREVLQHDSARSVVLDALKTTTASEALANRLHRSFTAAGSQAEISESDIAQVLGPTRSQEAQDIFLALDKDENGDVSLEEMTSLITQTSKDKDSMRRGLHDIGQAIQSLDNLLCFIVLLAAGLIYAAFFSQAIASRITALWGGIAATSFAISGTVQEFLGACIFLFVKHPYDVGDHFVINDTNMAVEQISLMYSVFRQIDSGSIVQISNMVNNAAWIRNISRSKPMKESYDFAISAKTKFPAIDNLKTELQAFVLAAENRRDFQPAIDVELISVGNLKELKLRVKICQKSNFANDSLYSRRRTKFMFALLSALRKHDIKSPGGGGPPPVGSWENPGYSVAVTDTEAQEARAQYEAEEEAKRLKKLKEYALKLNTTQDPDKKPDEFAAAASVVTHLDKWREAATQSKDDVFSSAYNSVTAQEQSYDSAARSKQHSDYPEDYGADTEEDDLYQSRAPWRTMDDGSTRLLAQPLPSYQPQNTLLR